MGHKSFFKNHCVFFPLEPIKTEPKSIRLPNSLSHIEGTQAQFEYYGLFHSEIDERRNYLGSSRVVFTLKKMKLIMKNIILGVNKLIHFIYLFIIIIIIISTPLIINSTSFCSHDDQLCSLLMFFFSF